MPPTVAGGSNNARSTLDEAQMSNIEFYLPVHHPQTRFEDRDDLPAKCVWQVHALLSGSSSPFAAELGCLSSPSWT
jgi:hypothetical protein